MSTSSAEILCSRCGTPFPQERGKSSVTCVVCGQLRPDLDMTLDDDDDDLASALGSGAAGASLRPSAEAAAHSIDDMPRPTHVILPRETMPQEETFRIERPFVTMEEEAPAKPARRQGSGDSLTDRVGPVLLIVAPLASGMFGALNMLQRVPDFSKGSWYAVGTVFVAILIATLFGGVVASGIFYTVRLRWTLLLRGIFLAVTVAIGYYGVQELPSHIQVRQDDLPGIVLR